MARDLRSALVVTTRQETIPEHHDEANPAPWWVSAFWLSFLVFAFSDLAVNLLRLG